MPKASQKSIATGDDMEEVDEEIPLHGTINKEESKLYRESLDKVFCNMATNIEEHVANAMQLAITDLKVEVVKQIPGVDEADTIAILKSIWDPSCLAMREQTKEVVAKLEEILPESDTTSGNVVIEDINEVEPLTKEQRQDIGEVFDNLKITHEHFGQSCGLIGVLSCPLSSRQLLLLLKASVRPLVQINKLGCFLDEPKASTTGSGLPESRDDRVCTTMILAPSVETIKTKRQTGQHSC